mmetsp:Transcript_53399/g.117240  ORF Transcript_53399/g.117240 Transcript_53399/m.117240 type:complete len:274 (-) Transcript_53399:358-1179(-)
MLVRVPLGEGLTIQQAQRGIKVRLVVRVVHGGELRKHAPAALFDGLCCPRTVAEQGVHFRGCSAFPLSSRIVRGGLNTLLHRRPIIIQLHLSILLQVSAGNPRPLVPERPPAVLRGTESADRLPVNIGELDCPVQGRTDDHLHAIVLHVVQLGNRCIVNLETGCESDLVFFRDGLLRVETAHVIHTNIAEDTARDDQAVLGVHSHGPRQSQGRCCSWRWTLGLVRLTLGCSALPLLLLCDVQQGNPTQKRAVGSRPESEVPIGMGGEQAILLL